MKLNVLVYILAGGYGSRLYPLTHKRAKPAVPFGGRYRLIDIPASNCLNSGIERVHVLTQYESRSLTDHLKAWSKEHYDDSGRTLDLIGAAQTLARKDQAWFRGTADAITTHLLDDLKDYKPDIVCILPADQLYMLNLEEMIHEHHEHKADLTVSTIRKPISEAAGNLGVVSINDTWEITDFHEKPMNPAPIRDGEEDTLASMGIYVFTASSLFKALNDDRKKEFIESKLRQSTIGFSTETHSSHDFGHDIIPGMIADYRVRAFDFSNHMVPGSTPHNAGYWTDVGLIKTYYKASLEQTDINPQFNDRNGKWRVKGRTFDLPISKVNKPTGPTEYYLMGDDCLIEGSIQRAVLGHRVHVSPEATVKESIIYNTNTIPRGAHIERAIIDKEVIIPEGLRITPGDISPNPSQGLVINDDVLVVPKGYNFKTNKIETPFMWT